MKSIVLILCLIIIVGCNTSNSQSPAKKDSLNLSIPIGYVNTFFKKYQEQNPSKALDYIFSINPMQTDTSQLTGMKNKLEATRQLIGNFDGQELITQKSTSSSLILLSYLAKHDKEPIRFTFVFYKPKDIWLLYKFKFDDQVDSELEESGKIYFIR